MMLLLSTATTAKNKLVKLIYFIIHSRCRKTMLMYLILIWKMKGKIKKSLRNFTLDAILGLRWKKWISYFSIWFISSVKGINILFISWIRKYKHTRKLFKILSTSSTFTNKKKKVFSAKNSNKHHLFKMKYLWQGQAERRCSWRNLKIVHPWIKQQS